MTNETDAIIEQIGPALTTQYISVLIERGVKPATARKRVQRATAFHTKLAGL